MEELEENKHNMGLDESDVVFSGIPAGPGH